MALLYRYTNLIGFVCLIMGIVINAKVLTLDLNSNSTEELLVEKTTQIVGIYEPDPIIANGISEAVPMTNITESQILLSIFSLGIGQVTKYAHAAKLVKDLKANGSTKIEEQYLNSTGDNIFEDIAYPTALAVLLAYSGKPNYETAKFVESLPQISQEICEKNHYAKTYGEGENVYGQVNPLERHIDDEIYAFQQAHPLQIGEENHHGTGGKGKTPETNVGWNIGPEYNHMDAPSTNVRNDLNVGGDVDTSDLADSNVDWNIKAEGDYSRSQLSSGSSIDDAENPSMYVPENPSMYVPENPSMYVPENPSMYVPEISSIPEPKASFLEDLLRVVRL